MRSEAFVYPSGEVISVAGFSSESGLEGAAYRSEDGGASWGVVLLDTRARGWFVLDSLLHGVLDSLLHGVLDSLLHGVLDSLLHGVLGFGVYASNDALDTGTFLAKARHARPDSFDRVRITADPRNLDVFAVTSVSEGGVASEFGAADARRWHFVQRAGA